MSDTASATEATGRSGGEAPGLEAWRRRVEAELKGVPFDKLKTKLLEGFAVEPLYTAAPADAPRPPWPVTQGGPALVEVTALGPCDGLDLTADELAGATAVDELALALHRLAARLRAGPLDTITVRVAIGTDLLLQIAKLRALRLLVARLAELTEAPLSLTVHALSSLRSFTVHDPWTNLLRNTASVFAAVVGGADLVTPMPYDVCLGTSDEAALRFARNTVHLALEEAWLGAVADPAAGSFALETWTHELCAAAWAAFQDLERGADAAARLRQVAAERHKRVARRQDGLIGTTLFPNLGEDLPARAGAPLAPTSPRLAEPFERLRATPHEPTPTVFLANVGPIADHTTRAMWVKGFYEAGGIATLGNDGFDTAEACAAAFAASGAPIAILCAADAAFADLPAFARALRAAGAHEVLVAGRPGEHEAALREAGVETFVFAGMDVLAELTRVHARHFGGKA